MVQIAFSLSSLLPLTTYFCFSPSLFLVVFSYLYLPTSNCFIFLQQNLSLSLSLSLSRALRVSLSYSLSLSESLTSVLFISSTWNFYEFWNVSSLPVAAPLRIRNFLAITCTISMCFLLAAGIFSPIGQKDSLRLARRWVVC